MKMKMKKTGKMHCNMKKCKAMKKNTKTSKQKKSGY